MVNKARKIRNRIHDNLNYFALKFFEFDILPKSGKKIEIKYKKKL
jgi:hypothetical protein